MRVIVPHTNLSAETQRALIACGSAAWPVMFVKLTDDEAYWRLMRNLWAERLDFAIVEHDIVIHKTVLPQFDECEMPWCSFGYPYGLVGGKPYHGSGCVRYRAPLMEAMPDLYDRVGEMSGRNHPRRHWCSLDGFTRTLLWQAGHQAHRHDPPVGHTDTETSHTCGGIF